MHIEFLTRGKVPAMETSFFTFLETRSVPVNGQMLSGCDLSRSARLVRKPTVTRVTLVSGWAKSTFCKHPQHLAGPTFFQSCEDSLQQAYQASAARSPVQEPPIWEPPGANRPCRNRCSKLQCQAQPVHAGCMQAWPISRPLPLSAMACRKASAPTSS